MDTGLNWWWTPSAGWKDQAILCVTHDLRFAQEVAQQMAVLYASQQVEWCSKEAFFREPLHPYSQAMLAALPENGLPGGNGLCARLGRIPNWRGPAGITADVLGNGAGAGKIPLSSRWGTAEK